MEATVASLVARLDDLVAAVDPDDDPEELVIVARSRPDALRPYHVALLDAGVDWPPELFYDADEATARHVLTRIDQDGERVDRLVCVLAATRTSTAAEAFARWRSDPPVWGPRPEILLRCSHWGGWELDEAGQVRQLGTEAALALVVDTTAGSATSAVSSGGTPAATCGCGLPMWRLLDVDLADPALAALDLAGAGRVGVLTCFRCGNYERRLYTEYGPDGACRPAPENRVPEIRVPENRGNGHDNWPLPEETPGLTLGGRRATPHEASAWAGGGSTLGGRPDWIQDPDYPVCPRCSRTMRYLGMVVGDDLWGESAEGCHYLFVDPDCRLSAAVYQQS